MAKIILDIDLNIKEAKSSLSTIKKELEGIGESAPKDMTKQINNLQKSTANLLNTIKNTKASYGEGIFEKTESDARKLLSQIKLLSSEYKKENANVKEVKSSYDFLSKSLTSVAKAFATTRAESEKLQKAEKLAIPNVDKLRGKLASLALSVQSVGKNYKKGTFTQITDEINRLRSELTGTQSMDTTSKEYAEALNNIDAQIVKLTADFKATRAESENFHGSIRDIVGGFLKFQLAARVVMVPLQALRNMWQSLNQTLVETEDRIVAIQRVVRENIGKGEMAKELYDIAIAYGQTFENVSEIATNFARSGLSWNETIEATRSAVLALNVAELDATQATEGLLAVMAQFNMSTDDLTGIIDKMNKTSDNYLVTTDKILKALQRTGSAAANANLSFEQTVGLITTLSSATNRSGENIGTALNSLIQYSGKESALSVFSALSEDSARVVEEYKKGAATILDVWKQVSVEINSLSESQANMLDAYFNTEDGSALKEALDGELQDFYTEVGGVYDTANTYRKNYFIALLKNIDIAESAIQGMQDAQGYSAKENAKYMESYTAKVNSLKAQWQEIANDEQGLLGIKKKLVESASGLLEFGQKIGGLKTTLTAIASITASIFGPKIILGVKNFIIGLKNAGTAATSLGTSLNLALGVIGVIVTSTTAIVSLIQNAKEEAKQAAQQAAETAISEWSKVENKANELVSFYSELNNLSGTENRTIEQENEYKNIQKEIVGLLGNRADKLNELKEGTDEYLGELKKITLEDIQKYYQLAEVAAIASNKLEFGQSEGNFVFSKLDLDKKVVDFLEKQGGFSFGAIGRGFLGLDLQHEFTTRDGIYSMYDQVSRAREILSKEDKFNRTDTYLAIANEAQSLYEQIEKRLKDNASFAVWSFIKDNGSFPKTKEQLEDIVEKTIESAGATEEWRDEVEKILKETVNIKNETDNIGKNAQRIVDNLSEITDNQKDIASAMKEYRSEQEKAAQIEEKQLAIQEAKKKVLEAQQALVSAYNERNTRVYNAETGEFELQASGKSISSAQKNLQTAQENLDKAIESLDKYVEEQAWNDVIAELEAGTATNEKILDILETWAGKDSDSGNYPNWMKEILDVLSKESGLDIYGRQRITDEERREAAAAGFENAQEIGFGGVVKEFFGGLFGSLFGRRKYDNGGVLSGLGGIKATARPETVNDPDLTAKILSPSSNEQFSNYVRDMNLLFGASESYAKRPAVTTFHGGTTTNNNGNTYVINGMSISQEQADNYSVSEIFSNFPIA